jgi:hypothetical protein
MRQTTSDAAGQFVSEPEWEIDAELFDEVFDAQALAGIETDLEDVEPWQRLGDLLGRLTGEVDTD